MNIPRRVATTMVLLTVMTLVSCGGDTPPQLVGIQPSTTQTAAPIVQVLPSGKPAEKVVLSTETVPQKNCGGSTAVSAGITRSRTIAYTIDAGAELSVNASGAAKVSGVGEVQVGATVAARYGVTYGREDTLSRSLTLSAKEGTHIEHTIEQVEYWETGELVITAGSQTLTYPYRFRKDFGLEFVESKSIPCPTNGGGSPTAAAQPTAQPTAVARPTAVTAPTSAPQPTEPPAAVPTGVPAGVGAQLFADSFDGALKPEWQVAQTGLASSNGRLVGFTGVILYPPSVNNYSIRGTAAGSWQLYFRTQVNTKGEVTHGYYFYCNDRSCSWYRLDDKANRQISNWLPRDDDFAAEDMHTITLDVQGSDFTFKVDDKVFSSIRDTTYGEGLLGIGGVNNSNYPQAQWDEFQVTSS